MLSLRSLPWVVSVALVSLAGCAPGSDVLEQDDTDSSSDALTQATLEFGAAWNEDVSGVLAEGGSVVVHYDDSRLAQCKGTQNGIPQYAVTAHYSVAGGPVHDLVVAGLNAAPQPKLTLDSVGELSIWFEATNKWGCHAWDSNFGDNYRFQIVEEPSKPNWIGNAVSVVARQTCTGGPCDDSRRDLGLGVSYDTWARQRAAIRSIYFDVWEPGVTDFDNADLWQQLDAQVHYRWSGQSGFQTEYVNFFRRNGNDARYELPLRPLDPMHGNVINDPATECPAGALTLSPDGFYVRTTLELYFTVNGKELRPAPGATYTVVFEDYKERYTPCL